MALQTRLTRLFSRGTEARQVRSLADPPIELATELGRRTENQDRVAVIRMRSALRSNESVVAIAVSDGMGGMRDGGGCASLTLAAFFEGLLSLRTLSLTDRVRRSTLLANERVHAYARGEGGATLSAVVVEPSLAPSVVNVGDSRIYCDVTTPDGNRTLDRLTVDDSLADAFGGEGRDLLQFIGMGEGLTPHIRDAPSEAQGLLITTDGVHFLDSTLFTQIFLQSDTLKQAVDRLAALARWFGGPDNATIAAFALGELRKAEREMEEGVLEIWTPSESLEILRLPGSPGPTPQQGHVEAQQQVHVEVQQDAHRSLDLAKPRRDRARKTRTRKDENKNAKPEQLRIEVEVGNGSSSNAHRGKV
jgi:serine/threonine protein phosphatase PrpC